MEDLSTMDGEDLGPPCLEDSELSRIKAQLIAKSYECSVWKKRAFQLGREVAASCLNRLSQLIAQCTWPRMQNYIE